MHSAAVVSSCSLCYKTAGMYVYGTHILCVMKLSLENNNEKCFLPFCSDIHNFSCFFLLFLNSLSPDFKFKKIIPPYLKNRCLVQSWEDTTGLKEGWGVVATKVIPKGTPVCNYGEHFMVHEYVKDYLLPFEYKSDYLLEMEESFRGTYQKFIWITRMNQSRHLESI